jgi:hypothetical protein
VGKTATSSPAEKLSVLALGTTALTVVVGTAFALGWVIGRLL